MSKTLGATQDSISRQIEFSSGTSVPLLSSANVLVLDPPDFNQSGPVT
jgi:hypothetical protein